MESTELPYDLEDNTPTFTEHGGGVLRHECKAWLPDGILGPKARGFVNDYADKLWEVSQQRARLRIGGRSLLPGWMTGGEVPLELTITLSSLADTPGEMRKVTADIRALGHFVPRDQVRQRGLKLIRALRFSLMAQDLVEKQGRYVFDDE